MRTIDADRRRRDLADAVWRIVVRDGLPAVSVRSVAAEAGLSAGSVRHFFPEQAALLNFAMTELAATVTRRVQAAATTEDLPARVLAMLVELLPVTDRTHAEFAAYLEFLHRSRTEPALREVARGSIRAVRDLVTTILTDLGALGLLREGVDVNREAVRLHAFLDGLTLQLVVDPELGSREEARRALSDWLRDLEGREPR